jgi:hypothetical protein
MAFRKLGREKWQRGLPSATSQGGFQRLPLRHERPLSTFAAMVYFACFPIACAWTLLKSSMSFHAPL